MVEQMIGVIKVDLNGNPNPDDAIFKQLKPITDAGYMIDSISSCLTDRPFRQLVVTYLAHKVR